MTNLSDLQQEVAEMREDSYPDLSDIESKVVGICTTCKHQEACAYMANSTDPVFHCEEFETETAISEYPVTLSEDVDTEPEQTRNLIGLCKNCESRLTCTLAKSEQGVWHCEEYS